MSSCLLAVVAAAAILLQPLASAAPAFQIPFKQTPQQRISSAVFTELEGLAGLAAIVSLRDGVGPAEGSLGLEIIERWGDDVVGTGGVRGFVATDDGNSGESGDWDGRRRIVAVFDGDYGFDDALEDEVAPSGIEYPHGGGSGVVHEGALNAWESVKETVTRALDEAIETSGHSQLRVIGRGIGGSVAAFAALEFAMKGLKPRLTTFGQPRFGDAEFMGFFDEKIPAEDYQRVTHLLDPVPLVEHRELQLVHTNEEYFIIKPFLPYTPSDIHVCFPDSPDSDAVCSAHFRTRAFDLDFMPPLYFVDPPSPSPSQMTSGDVDLEVTIEVVSFDLPVFDSALASPSTFPSSLDFGLSSLFSAMPKFIFDWGEGEKEESMDSPVLSKRSAAPTPGTIDRAIEYFHASKDVLAAAVAASDQAAAEQRRKKEEGEPEGSIEGNEQQQPQQQAADGEDMISKASSVILCNGRPLETNGRPLHSRSLSRKGKPIPSPKSRKGGKPKGKKDSEKGGPGETILTLEYTTPSSSSSTTSDTVIQDTKVDRTQNTRQDEVVNVDKGRNFRTINGRPVLVVKHSADSQQVSPDAIVEGWEKWEGGGDGGKWEEEMKSLQEMRGPIVFTRASEDPKDSEAWAGEAPNHVVKDRFLVGPTLTLV